MTRGDRATAPLEGIWCVKIRGCSYRGARLGRGHTGTVRTCRVPERVTYQGCRLHKSDMPPRCPGNVVGTIQWGLSPSACEPRNNHKQPDWRHRYMTGHANLTDAGLEIARSVPDAVCTENLIRV
jgi:hypothetical protein